MVIKSDDIEGIGLGLAERLRLRWRAAGLTRKLAAGLVSAPLTSMAVQSVWGLASIKGMVWLAVLIPLLAAIAAIFFLLSVARPGVEDLLFIAFLLLAGYFYAVGSYSYPRDAICLLTSVVIAVLSVKRFRALLGNVCAKAEDRIKNRTRAKPRDLLLRCLGVAKRSLALLVSPLRHPAKAARVLSGRLSQIREPHIPLDLDQIKLPLVFLLTFWVLSSVADEVGRSATLPHGYQGRALGANAGRWGNARAGLALSGGGYRAAILHAGVLSALDEMGVPVGAVSSVSGGSIIGSFYAVGGSPRAFVEAVAEGRFKLGREISHVHNFVPLALTSRFPFSSYSLVPFTNSYGPSQVQARLLDKVLLGGVRMKDVGGGTLPELMLCATDLTTKRVVGITRLGVIGHELVPGVWRTPAENLSSEHLVTEAWSGPDFGVPGDLPLSTFVAASGAFPGPFNPVEVDGVFDLSAKAGLEGEREVFRNEWSLADGGIADNLGLDLMLVANLNARLGKRDQPVRQAAHESASKEPGLVDYMKSREVNLPEWDVDLIVASDGGEFYVRTDTRPHSYASEIARTIDAVYATSGSRLNQPDLSAFSLRKAPPVILLTPAALVERVSEFDLLPKAPSLTAGRFVYEAAATSMLGRASAYYGFTSLDQDDLRRLIRELPGGAAADADRLMKLLPSQGVVRADDSAAGFPEDVDCETAASAGQRLYCLLRKDLDDCLLAFASTSTLEDDVSRERAERIYRLGRYLVWLNAPAIEKAIQGDDAQPPGQPK